LVWSLLLYFVTSSAAPATVSVVLISNTNQPSFASPPVVFAGQWLAAPFVTGPSAARLDSISLPVDSGFGPTGTFWVTIYGDNAGLPGSPLAGGLLNGPSHPTSAYQTYSALPSLVLAPTTKYWVVAASDDPATSGGAYDWWDVNTTNYTSNFGWTFFNYDAFTSNGGTTWISTETAETPHPLFLAINGAIIPEPSSLLLVPFGAAILFVHHHSRRLSRLRTARTGRRNCRI
jgi:hypothetical protein